MAKALKTFKTMETDKATYLSVWDDINRFVFPNSEQFMAEYKGGERRRKVKFDGTAERALEIFAASLMGLVANPAAKYITFKPRNPKLIGDKSIQEFIEQAQTQVLAVFNDPATKFYDNLFYCFQYLGAYGTTSLLSDKDDKHVATFRAEGPKGLNFTESFNGTVEEVFLEREFTVQQLLDLKDKESWDIPEDYKRKNADEKVKLIRHIYPNPNYNPESLKQEDKRYKSDYYLKQDEKLVKQSGFSTFPAPVSRWGKLDAEKWGDSPARVALTDVKILNASERHLTFAEEYSLRPSLFVSSEAKFGKLNLSAGAVNVGRGNPADTIKQLSINGDLTYSLERNRLRREVVMQAFYVDIFQTLSNNDMTATEAQIRQQERLRGLAPKVARVQSDLLGPTAERILYMLIERGDLKPPAAMQGQMLEVAYISPIATAQRAQDAVSIQLFLQDLLMSAQVNPSVLDIIDFDATVKELADIRGIPTKLLLDDKKIKEIREARQKQQELQQGLSIAQQAGDAGQALGKATNEQAR